MKRRQNSRDAILDAAEQLVVDKGAPSLTLDAVAARAGVSKGGLLYNFTTKEALLEAMIARLCDRFDDARTVEEAHKSRGPASSLQAYLSVTLDREPGWDRVAGGLLAAIANDLNLLKPVREHYERWLEQLAERPTFEREVTVWLAGQGLWLMELLRVSPFNPKQRRQVTRYLNAMTRDATAMPQRVKRGKSSKRKAL